MNAQPNNPENDLGERVNQTERELAQAVQRLRNLQRAALYGSYSAEEFNSAVERYRRARAEAYEAREAWQRWQAGQQRAATPPPASRVMAVGGWVPSPHPHDDQPYTLVVTPRLLFMQWLVQTGRMTEWPEGRPAV